MLKQDDIDVIRACFDCSEQSAAQLASGMVSRNFAHRATLALQGDPCAHLHLVVQGHAVAELFGADGQHAQLSKHGPGEIFGAYPEPTTYRSNLVSQGEVRLLSISSTKLSTLAESHPDIGAGLARLLARQLDLVLDRMAARIGLSATGRFYRVLLQLADTDGFIRPAPVIAALALSVHTTRETASRALTTLTRRGIVERNGESLRIISRRMLEEMVV